MELKEIKELIQLMKKSDLTEIDLERENFKLSLKRSHRTERVMTAPDPVPSSAPTPPQPTPETDQSPVAAETSTSDPSLQYITAPLVGTFYSAPSPDAEVFVSVGDTIKKGQVLCIVEAMKLMNEIESEVEGTVVEILCENATPVEYGSKMFAVQTAWN